MLEKSARSSESNNISFGVLIKIFFFYPPRCADFSIPIKIYIGMHRQLDNGHIEQTVGEISLMEYIMYKLMEKVRDTLGRCGRIW